MNKSLVLFAIVLFASLGSLGQSARRVPPTPTPTPAPTPLPYSETTPTPRRPRYTERFPGIGDGPKAPIARPKAAPVVLRTPTPAGDDETVRVDTNLITIPVSVYDRAGLYIPNLKQEDFKVFEDGKEQQIEYFGSSDKPFTVVLLIDTSPSTEYQIEEIHAAAAAFVGLLKPQDNVMVIEFDGNPHILSEPTNDRAKILKAIKKADWGSGTALYDAVDLSLRKRLNLIQGRKAVVLFTDGVDTQSSKANYDTTLDLAEESDSLIFPIYYNTFSTQPANMEPLTRDEKPLRDPLGQSKEEYALGKRYLEELALYTGGRVFQPENTPGGLKAAFEGIAEELRRQYNIGYVPPDEGKIGQRKQIRVRVDRPNLIVRSRDSYIVGAETQSAAQTKPE